MTKPDGAKVALEGLRKTLDDPEQGGILSRLIEGKQIDKPDSESRVDLTVAIPAFFKELRAEMRATTASAAAERARAARAEAQELHLAETLREMVAVDEVEAVVDQLCGVIVTTLVALPARVSRDLAVRRRIEEFVRRAQTALADHLTRNI